MYVQANIGLTKYVMHPIEVSKPGCTRTIPYQPTLKPLVNFNIYILKDDHSDSQNYAERVQHLTHLVVDCI